MNAPYTRRKFLHTTLSAAAAPLLARESAEPAGFTFGIVADAQYADVEPRGSRYYRAALPRLAAAVEHFEAQPLAFCVHLGDLIDRDWASFDAIEQPLARSRHRWVHVLGNHDFDVADHHKPAVSRRLGRTGRYGAFDHGDVRFVVLDTNDVSTYAHPAGTAAREAAERELARAQAAGLRQAKPWNGAIGASQLAWFDRTCMQARSERRRVVILAHHPVFPDNDHNVWNAAEVLAVIDRHPHVVAWLNGHNHAGAFGERNEVPFLTLRGMVETAETTAFATARLAGDLLTIAGKGREPSRSLRLRPAATAFSARRP